MSSLFCFFVISLFWNLEGLSAWASHTNPAVFSAPPECILLSRWGLLAKSPALSFLPLIYPVLSQVYTLNHCFLQAVPASSSSSCCTTCFGDLMATTCESSTKCVFSTSSVFSTSGLVIVTRLIGLPPRILRTSLSPFSASSAPHWILSVLSASHHTPSDGYKAAQHRPSLHTLRASLVVQMAKSPPAMQETQGPSLGWEDPLEEGMATHSSILAWRIPMDRGVWLAAVHGVAICHTYLQMDTKQLSMGLLAAQSQNTLCFSLSII